MNQLTPSNEKCVRRDGQYSYWLRNFARKIRIFQPQNCLHILLYWFLPIDKHCKQNIHKARWSCTTIYSIMSIGNKWGVIFVFGLHILFLASVFDIYFRSPVISSGNKAISMSGTPPAQKMLFWKNFLVTFRRTGDVPSISRDWNSSFAKEAMWDLHIWFHHLTLLFYFSSTSCSKLYCSSEETCFIRRGWTQSWKLIWSPRESTIS